MVLCYSDTLGNSRSNKKEKSAIISSCIPTELYVRFSIRHVLWGHDVTSSSGSRQTIDLIPNKVLLALTFRHSFKTTILINHANQGWKESYLKLNKIYCLFS